MSRARKFEVVHEQYQTVIQDTEQKVNFAFLAESGFGLGSSTVRLAQKVCDFLNSLPPEETNLLPPRKS